LLPPTNYSALLASLEADNPAWKLETKEFSVRQALDPRAFHVPENAAPGAQAN